MSRGDSARGAADKFLTALQLIRLLQSAGEIERREESPIAVNVGAGVGGQADEVDIEESGPVGGHQRSPLGPPAGLQIEDVNPGTRWVPDNDINRSSILAPEGGDVGRVGARDRSRLAAARGDD